MRLIVCLLSFMCLTILAVLPEDERNNAEDDRARPAQHGLHRVPAMLDLSAMREPDGTKADEGSGDERGGARRRSRLGDVSARPGEAEIVIPMERRELLDRSARAKNSAKAVLAEARRRAAANIEKYLQEIAEKERKRQRAAAAEQARQEEAAAAHADFAGEEAVEGDSDDDYTDVEDPEFQRALEELCRNRQD